MKPHIVAWCWW